MNRQDWILHLSALGTTDPAPLPPDPTLFDGTRGEHRLWRACRDAPRSGPVAPCGVAREVLGARRGPLLSQDAFLAIEVWTECELAALHALHRIARAASGAGLADAVDLHHRAHEAIRWHLEHTQPDNATNRPWALHAFLLADDGSGEATAYAGTLLHNMSASHARSEALSRWILADAARELAAHRD